MKTQKIDERNIVFTYKTPEWDLNLHLIMGRNRDYIIDTGLGSESVAPIKEYLSGRKPVVVINTHYHWDHVWGNHCFPGAIIIAHRLCGRLIEESWAEKLNKYKAYVRGEVIKRLPNLAFDGGLYFPDDGIRVFYTPGHTIDCVSVFDELGGVLNAGDNIGDTPDEIVPDIDTDRDTYLRTIKMYKELNAAVCISGHNKVLGKETFDKIEEALGC